MCFNCPGRTKCNADLFERLAQYEDSGLTPEQVKHYKDIEDKMADAGCSLKEEPPFVHKDSVPIRPKVVAVTLIRNRNELLKLEQWADTLYLPISEEELGKVKNGVGQGSLNEWAIQTLRSNVTKFLQSKRGWQSICNSCFDYNWGDYMMEMAQDIGALELPIEQMEIIDAVQCFVAQDEVLIPQEVPVRFRIVNCNGEFVLSGYCTADFSTGEVAIPEGYSFRTGDVGVVFLSNGDELDLDSEESLIRLKGAV